MKFSHTVESKATPQTLWSFWTDVEQWHTWDTELMSASLKGPFALNTAGALTPKRGPKVDFWISQLDEGKRYTFTTQLMFAQLHVARSLEERHGRTLFTHEVSFTGPLAWLFGRLLGGQYEKVLPQVMEQLSRLAEEADRMKA